jgi:hypothetical protein
MLEIGCAEYCGIAWSKEIDHIVGMFMPCIVNIYVR